jgi:hypothetical protein
MRAGATAHRRAGRPAENQKGGKACPTGCVGPGEVSVGDEARDYVQARQLRGVVGGQAQPPRRASQPAAGSCGKRVHRRLSHLRAAASCRKWGRHGGAVRRMPAPACDAATSCRAAQEARGSSACLGSHVRECEGRARERGCGAPRRSQQPSPSAHQAPPVHVGPEVASTHEGLGDDVKLHVVGRAELRQVRLLRRGRGVGSCWPGEGGQWGGEGGRHRTCQA